MPLGSILQLSLSPTLSLFLPYWKNWQDRHDVLQFLDHISSLWLRSWIACYRTDLWQFPFPMGRFRKTPVFSDSSFPFYLLESHEIIVCPSVAEGRLCDTPCPAGSRKRKCWYSPKWDQMTCLWSCFYPFLPLTSLLPWGSHWTFFHVWNKRSNKLWLKVSLNAKIC